MEEQKYILHTIQWETDGLQGSAEDRVYKPRIVLVVSNTQLTKEQLGNLLDQGFGYSVKHRSFELDDFDTYRRSCGAFGLGFAPQGLAVAVVEDGRLR